MWLRRFLIFALWANSALCQTLEWGSTLFETNLTSDGETLSSEWSFALGYFSGGFVPTVTNTSEWSEEWSTLEVAPYSEQTKRFNSVWTDTGQVPDGRKGYIWGLNRESEDPEWILVSAADWTFPLPPSSPINPGGGSVWSISDGNEVVLGTVDVAGVHMRTAPAIGSPPLLSGELWRRLVFLPAEQNDEEVTAWTADPDLDDNTNLMEFAFGLDPKVRDRIQTQTVVGSGFFDFEIRRARNVAVNYFGRVSNDLENWSEAEADVILLEETDGALIYRSPTPITGQSKQFGQVRVTLKP